MTESMRQRLERVLRSPDDEAALEELKQIAPEFRAELLESPIEPSEDPSPELLEWVAHVYEVIGEALETPVPDSVWTAQPSELSDVGKAFANVLVADLPQTLTNFESWFAPAEAKLTHQLLKREDVRSAGDWGNRLACTGLAPLTFHHATEAVSGLIDRLMRHEDVEQGTLALALSGEIQVASASGESLMVDEIALGRFGRVRNLALGMPATMFRKVADAVKPRQVEKPQDAIDRDLLVEEIAAVAECSETTAEAMLRWLIEAARYRPLLFRHFLARPTPDGIELDHLVFELGASEIPPTRSAPENLFQRWGLTLDTVHEWLDHLGVAMETPMRVENQPAPMAVSLVTDRLTPEQMAARAKNRDLPIRDV